MITLAGNARLDEAVKVVEAYSQLMKAKRGEVDAVITSAKPLSKAQTDAIAAALKAEAGKGKSVSLTSIVNPDILGGLQVRRYHTRFAIAFNFTNCSLTIITHRCQSEISSLTSPPPERSRTLPVSSTSK